MQVQRQGLLAQSQSYNERIQTEEVPRVGFSGRTRASEWGDREFCLQDGQRGMGNCREQEEQEKEGGYLSGKEGTTEDFRRPPEQGGSGDSNLQQGWRDRTNNHSFPGGWRVEPADHTTGPPGAGPAGRCSHVKKRKISREEEEEERPQPPSEF